MSKYTKTMSEVLAEMSEGFSKKEIKMAIGVASDPRYKGGNYTGAFKAIEKIKKGLASHPQVAAVLKRQNTSFDPEIAEAGHDDVASAKNQVKVAMSALQKMETELGKLGDEDSLPTWWTNKVAIAVDKLDGMADYLDTQVEEVELDEAKFSDGMIDKLKKAYEPMKGKKINPTPLMKIFDKIDSNKDGLEQLYKADIPFVSMMAMSRLMLKHNYKADDINKLGKIRREDFVLDEAINEAVNYNFAAVDKKGKVIGFSSKESDAKDMARRNKGRVVTLTKPLAPKKGDMMVNRPFPDEMDKFPTNTSATQGKRMEEVELDEGMKMNDPKLLKMFDKLKKGDKIKLKTSSTISQGKDFVEYIVKSKNTVNKGKVEKITLATVGNEKAVKKYLYKRDGTVGFAIGDMGASIDDIKESTNEVPENMAAYLAAITKQLGEK